MPIKTFEKLDQYRIELKSKHNHELFKIYYSYKDNLKLGYGLPIEFDLVFLELEKRGFQFDGEQFDGERVA